MSPLFVGFLVMVMTPSDQAPPDLAAVHPQVACWAGERSWTAAGEQPSQMVVFGTAGDPPPERIEHNVDEIWNGEQLEQRYNFLDYHFGNQGNPVVARIYLDDDPNAVAIRFREGQLPRNAAAARQLISADVLCYLQKRFGAIDALTLSGYVQIWTRN